MSCERLLLLYKQGIELSDTRNNVVNAVLSRVQLLVDKIYELNCIAISDLEKVLGIYCITVIYIDCITYWVMVCQPLCTICQLLFLKLINIYYTVHTFYVIV